MNLKSNTQCPSSADFEKYLSNQGNKLFKHNFETHLKGCELCSEAIDGYRFMASNPSEIKTHNPYKTKVIKWQSVISVAASVAILIGISIAGLNFAQKRNKQKMLAFTDSETMYFESPLKRQGPKKLTTNASSDYWYLGKEGQIEVNDCQINTNELDLAIKGNNNKSQIMVQVETLDYKAASEIITRLKDETGALVFTYSKYQGYKIN